MAKKRTEIPTFEEIQRKSARETHAEYIGDVRKFFSRLIAQLHIAPFIVEEIETAKIELERAKNTIGNPGRSEEEDLDAKYQEILIAKEIMRLMDEAKAATGFSEDKKV